MIWPFNTDNKILTFYNLSPEERDKVYTRWNSFGDNATVSFRHKITKLTHQVDSLTKELEMYKAFIGNVHSLKEPL